MAMETFSAATTISGKGPGAGDADAAAGARAESDRPGVAGDGDSPSRAAPDVSCPEENSAGSNGGLKWRRRRQHFQQVAEDVVGKATQLSGDVAAKARAQFSDSMFSHMFAEEATATAAAARRRAMMLVDVLVERHSEGPLRGRWLGASALITCCYLRYALPVYSSWGASHLESSMDPSAFDEIVGGAYSQVSFGVLILVTSVYISLLSFSARIMATRMPVKRVIFETLAVHNMTQTLMNLYVFVQLLRHARLQGFQTLWGNQFLYSRDSHSLGYYIWLHYHCCQLELFDTLFVVLRKKHDKITSLHVLLRLLNMWAWYFACRYACGGDAYFPAAVNAITRAVVYAFYSLSLLTKNGVPFVRKARITGVQILQFGICALHALYCLYTFWDMHIPRIVLVLYFCVMMIGLVLYTDFHYQVEGKSETIPSSSRRVCFSFDSSGWFYCYHFGVAAWVREHMIPEDVSPETVDKFPSELTFSGSSGGALVSGVIAMGLQPAEIFEKVLSKRHECRYNPFRMLPAAEDVLRTCMPSNAWKSVTGRIRVLLSRVSLKYPFFTAEVVTSFKTNEDVFHALRASCHVPVIAGMGPYRYDGHSYFDGMFWPHMLVSWKGSQDDHKIRVSAFSSPSSDIKPPVLPQWWSIFPPEEEILRGIFWMGYRDTARCFKEPKRPVIDMCACRKSSEDDSHGHEHSEAWKATRKLFLRTPAERDLPEVDKFTGKDPREFVSACEGAVERNKRLLLRVFTAWAGFSLLWLLLWGFM
eukprot:TRINITY_DN6484_c0_g1_i1.p1 TRINITY_DN6484_c0_g1~~TRINITY_DN6484_c0_g1_i1.p1  ORF type:complete len:759 (+),score=100.43 TRINITY_DN6484_c0_g1_i1:60-2336(+)